MLKKMYLGLILVILFSASFVFAASEELTITTYYPSPYGVYKTLRLQPSDDHAAGDTCSNEGDMAYDLSAHQTLVCNGAIWVEMRASEIKMYEADCRSTTGCTGDFVAGSFIFTPKEPHSVGDMAEVRVACASGERLIGGASFVSGEDEASSEHLNASQNYVRCRDQGFQAGDDLHFHCQAVCVK